MASPAIVNVTAQNFETEVLKSSTPVLVDFWAEWCGPCKAIAPLLDEAAVEFAGKITIAKLNADENPQTPQRMGVRSLPTLLLIKNGKVEGQKVGALRKTDLTAFIRVKILHFIACFAKDNMKDLVGIAVHRVIRVDQFMVCGGITGLFQ